MKELREFIRYSLEDGSRKAAFVEIEGINKSSGIISDLSTGGFSFVIDMNSITDPGFSQDKFFFVIIHYKKFVINAEVQKKWSIIKNADGDKAFIAGVSFKVISNEDRLRLNEIIENLRLESSLHILKDIK